MSNDKQEVSFRNYIGGKHIISESLWALTLVRRLGSEHAFLILEGVQQSQRVTQKVELTIKEGSDNTKAKITSVLISFNELKKIGDHCHSITWNITHLQAEAFIALLKSECERGDKGEINFITLGKAKIAGSVAASLEGSGLEDVVKASTDGLTDSRITIDQVFMGLPETKRGKFDELRFYASHYSAESVDMLLRNGHNCCSWAVAMIQAIQLEFVPFTPFIVVPSSIIKGNKSGMNYNDTKGSRDEKSGEDLNTGREAKEAGCVML